MGGSGHSGGTEDERGTLIRFPRPEWIPADGIEPLDTNDPEGSPGEPAAAGHEEGAERGTGTATIEAGDFWASGDTQEFVGVARSSSETAELLAPSTGGSTADAAPTEQERAELEPRLTERCAVWT